MTREPDTGIDGTRPIRQGEALTPALAQRFWLLSRRIVRHANLGVPRVEFLLEMSRLVLDFSSCDALEIRLWGPEVSLRWQAWAGNGRFELEMFPCPAEPRAACRFPRHPVLERVCRAVAERRAPDGASCFTPNGSFWTADARAPVVLEPGGTPVPLGVADDTRSLCLMGFDIDETNAGLLLLESSRPGLFSAGLVEYYEGMTQTLGLAIADRRAQAALRERVKELTCLYNIDRLVEQHGPDSAELLPGITEELRRAFLHPDKAAARITLDEEDIRTAGWRDQGPRLAVDIIVDDRVRGQVAVNYPETGTDIELEPFLPEERTLLEAVAREISLLTGRREAEIERLRLQRQLRHADRLATIGQLAAGIAHELNEPLANVLGFAQLAAGDPGLPDQAKSDVGRIEQAALHAREVIRKLMLFARQAPPRTGPVDLNELARDGLYFLEGRCAKNGIELGRELAAEPPVVEADASQLLQVLVNLVVNAIQAMPHGGRLVVATGRDHGEATLSVSDTGIGMGEEVRRQVFIPFFTTKDAHEGTGLGLAVVDGIVSAHGGTIEVESQVGVGSRFTVRLPLDGAETEHRPPPGGTEIASGKDGSDGAPGTD